MPLYEYRCGQCGRLTEKIQKFSDPELTVCPHCGGPLARTLTAPAVHFSGGGWYKDLYSSAKPAAASGDKPAGNAENTADKQGTGDKQSAGDQHGKGDKPGASAPSGDTGSSSSSSPAAPSTPAPAAGSASSKA